MNSEATDALLAKLAAGDATAMSQVLFPFGSYLRLVVRRQLSDRLRAKFDSADVVQSVWVHVLRRWRARGLQFTNRAHLRAYLVLEVRHRLTDRLRHYRTALERERPLAVGVPGVLPPSPRPRPSELVQAADLWERLLALCPPAHHELLRLKRQGLSLAELAERTGMHPDSIRRVLRQLARRLVAQDAPDHPPHPLR